MIYIKEGITKKLPGETSFFVNFQYKPEYVEIVKNCVVAYYDKKTTTWEVPLTDLAYLIDSLTCYDDISLSVIGDKEKSENKNFTLQQYKTTPYEYQLAGIQYGLNHDKWLLLDAPGLGKSLQIIYLAQELNAKEHLKHCLIICGVNTLKYNWASEIQKHSILTCKILGEKTSKSGKVSIGSVKERLEQLQKPIEEFFVITNIETLRNKDIVKEIMNNKENSFDMIVVDEIHTCKSVTSQQGKSLLKLNAKYMIGATGTLLLNDPIDAFVPLKWIEVERSNASTFKHYYYNYAGLFNNEFIGYRNLDILKTQLENHSLRRTKDLLELPPKTIINEYIELNEAQNRFYNNIKDGIIQQVDKVEISTASLLAMITRLRQASVCPSILTSENIPSSKIERACDLATQIIENGDKVVIFSTFKDSLKVLNEKLEKYNPLMCTGDDKDTTINYNIHQFQTNVNYKIFLCTWQKMGTGVTLTAASYAIFLDTPWTNAVYEQAQDRIHRIGSTNPVYIYNLICKDTIDERVFEIVNDKAAISEYVIDDTISQKHINSLKKYIKELANI